MSQNNIFISYGHNDFDILVHELVSKLREKDFNVFLDVDYLKTGDWEKIIDSYIKDCNWFIYIISKKSTKLNGYCLNELCRAGELNKKIIPLAFDESLTPLSINRLQRISFIECMTIDKLPIDELFDKKTEELINILEGKQLVNFSDTDTRIFNSLKPINNKYDIFNHYLDFCGRKEVFKLFENWVEEENSPIFWLWADPGAGKTAFSSALCWKYPNLISSIYFCKFNNSDRSDPKKIITSIAYQLSAVIPEYKEYLANLKDLDFIFDKNATRIFEYLIVEPFTSITQNKIHVIIIDALDEASWNENNEICNIILRNYKSLPSWLKIFVTSRNANEIRRIFNQFPNSNIQTSVENNKEDLKEYYITHLPENTSEEIINKLIEKSENSFLYASEVCKEIKFGRISLSNLDNLPAGIYGFFTDSFDRLFTNSNSRYEDIKPLIELLTISQEPITLEIAMDYLKCDEYVIRDMISKIMSFFPFKNNQIQTLHKSLVDWLLSSELSNKYYISKVEANKKLLLYIESIYSTGKYSDNNFVIKRFGQTLINLKKFDRLYEILQDKTLQHIRIERLHLDGGLTNYLNEINEIYKQLPEEIYNLYSGEAFLDILSTHRRLIYNSGLFFQLKKMGFSKFLKQAENLIFNLEAEVGIVFYYYIVEDFDNAIKRGKKLLSTNQEITSNPKLLAEVYNVLGLSYRKKVEFTEAINSFEKAIEYGEEVDHYEVSLAHLLISKIMCRTDQFDEAVYESKKAIRKIKKAIEEADGEKEKDYTLFMAEELRVFADTLIWHFDFDEAKMKIEECLEIYDVLKRTDRYYIRSKYTSCFLEIATNPSLQIESKLSQLYTKCESSRYDAAQINFLQALNLYVVSRKSNISDDEILKRATNYCLLSIDKYEEIESNLELAEAITLYNLINELRNIDKRKKIFDESTVTINWLVHVRKFIERICTNG